MTKPKATSPTRRPKASVSVRPPTTAAASPKGRTLETPPDLPGRTRDQYMAQVAADGIVGNARSLVEFGESTFGELSLTDCAMVLKGTAKALNDGDLTSAVTMLSAQAVALNAMFGELSRRSALNMGQYLDASERYLRLALKAQGQCRATLETLAAIKNPPVLFARQANINNGGQQQVNNASGAASDAESQPVRAHARFSQAGAHPGESASAPNELIEDGTHAPTKMDSRATAAAGRANQGLETVGALDRPANR